MASSHDRVSGSDEPTIVVHIGYHKTASSWLQSSLFPSVPEVQLIQDSEDVITELVGVNPFLFDPERARSKILGGRRGPGTIVLSMERLSGHPDSGGFDSRAIADRLAEVFPEGRVLIVIRRQPDIILAMYGEYVRTGGVESLRRYVRPLRGSHRAPRFHLRHLEYDRMIAHYESLFGRERVRVLAYEQLRADVGAFARAVTDFCDVPAPVEIDSGRVHPSMAPLTLGIKRRLNLVTSRDAVNPAGFIDSEGLADRVARRLNRLDRFIPAVVRERGRGRMVHIVEAVCAERFKESNRKTIELTGLPLAEFGYDV